MDANRRSRQHSTAVRASTTSHHAQLSIFLRATSQVANTLAQVVSESSSGSGEPVWWPSQLAVASVAAATPARPSPCTPHDARPTASAAPSAPARQARQPYSATAT